VQQAEKAWTTLQATREQLRADIEQANRDGSDLRHQLTETVCAVARESEAVRGVMSAAIAAA